MIPRLLLAILIVLTFTEVLSSNEEETVEVEEDDEPQVESWYKTTLLEPDSREYQAEGRLLWSYPQNPIIDLVMKSPAITYVPRNTKDPFDFLRDHYPLPNGKNVKQNYIYAHHT